MRDESISRQERAFISASDFANSRNDRKSVLNQLQAQESLLTRQAMNIRSMLSRIDDNTATNETSRGGLSSPKHLDVNAHASITKQSSDATLDSIRRIEQRRLQKYQHEQQQQSSTIAEIDRGIIYGSKSYANSRRLFESHDDQEGDHGEISARHTVDPFDPLYKAKKDLENLRQKREASMKERLLRNAEELERMERMRETAIEKARKDKDNALALRQFTKIQTKRCLQLFATYTQSQLRLKFLNLSVKIFKLKKYLHRMKVILPNHRDLRIRGMAYEMKLAGKRLLRYLVMNRNAYQYDLKCEIMGGRHYVQRIVRKVLKELRETPAHSLRRLLIAGNAYKQRLLSFGLREMKRWYGIIGLRIQSNRNRLQRFLYRKHLFQLKIAMTCFAIHRDDNLAERKAILAHESVSFKKCFQQIRKRMAEAHYRYELNEFADTVHARYLKRKFLRQFRQHVRSIRNFQMKRKRYRRVVFFKNPQSVLMNYFTTWFKKHLTVKRREVMVVKQIERLRKSNPTLSATLQRLRVRSTLHKTEENHFTVHKFYCSSIYLIGLNKAWRRFCVRVFQAAQRRLIKGRPRSLVVSNYYRRRYLKVYFQKLYQRKVRAIARYQKSRRLRCNKSQDLARLVFRKFRSHSLQLIRYDLARFHHRRRFFSRFFNQLRSMVNQRMIIRMKRDRNPLLRKLCVISLHKWCHFAATHANRKDLIRYMRAKTYQRRIKSFFDNWIVMTQNHADDDQSYRLGKKYWLRKSVVRVMRQWRRATFQFKSKTPQTLDLPTKKTSMYLIPSTGSSKSIKIKNQDSLSSKKNPKQLLSRSASLENEALKKPLSLRDQWYMQVMKKKIPILELKRYFKMWKSCHKSIFVVSKEKVLRGDQLYRMKALRHGMSKWMDRYEERVDQENLLGYYRMNVQIPLLSFRVLKRLQGLIERRHQEHEMFLESELHFTKTVTKFLLKEWKQRIQWKLQVFRPSLKESDVHYSQSLCKKYWPRFHHLMDQKFAHRMEMKQCIKHYKMKKTKPLIKIWRKFTKQSKNQYASYQLSKQRNRAKFGHSVLMAFHIFAAHHRNWRWDYEHARDFHTKKALTKSLHVWQIKIISRKVFRKNSIKLIRRWFCKLRENHDQRKQRRLSYGKGIHNATKLTAKEILKEWKQRIQTRLQIKKPLLRKSHAHHRKILMKKFLLAWETFVYDREVTNYELHHAIHHHEYHRSLKPALEKWTSFSKRSKRYFEMIQVAKELNAQKMNRYFFSLLQINLWYLHMEKMNTVIANDFYVKKRLQRGFQEFQHMIRWKRHEYDQQILANTHHETRLVRVVFNKGFKILLQEHMVRTSAFLTVLCQVMQKAFQRRARKQLQTFFEDWKKDTMIERKVALRLKFHHKQWYYNAFHRLKRRARQSKRLKRKVYGFIQMMLYKQRKLLVNQKDSPNAVVISFDCDMKKIKRMESMDPNDDFTVSIASAGQMENVTMSTGSSKSMKREMGSQKKASSRRGGGEKEGGKSGKERRERKVFRENDDEKFRKPANFYHDGLRWIQSLLHHLEKKRQEEDRLEQAQRHHDVMTKRFVIYQLFHLRRNRIANDFYLKVCFQRFRQQLLTLNQVQYSLKKQLKERVIAFVLKRYVKKWSGFLDIKAIRRQIQEKKKKKFPIYEEIDSFDYYWRYHQRLFFQKMKWIKKNKRKVLKQCHHYDQVHIQHKLFHGFHHLLSVCVRKSKKKRNDYLLSLFENIQQKRRAIRIWCSFKNIRFLQMQLKRLHSSDPLPTSAVVIRSSTMMKNEGRVGEVTYSTPTVRYNRRVKFAFRHLLQLVRQRKQKENLMKNPEKKREFLLHRQQAKSQNLIQEVSSLESVVHGANASTTAAKKILQAKKVREQKKLQSISIAHSLGGQQLTE